MGMIRLNTIKHYSGLQVELPTTLPYGDTYFSTDDRRYFVYDQDGSPREITSGSIEEVEQIIKTNIQGYIGLLSAYYFDGAATESSITIDQVDVWQDVVMTIHPNGTSDQRVADMKTAQAQGYSGTGAVGDPIIFLLEGLVEQSAANLRTSLTFVPDEDGGRLDSRAYFERHSGAGNDFTIEASGLAMEGGADESYANNVNIQFFVGDSIDTNAPGDAGKIKFQIKSDVTGTVFMNEMALFIQL
jgi:hypothetical protein